MHLNLREGKRGYTRARPRQNQGLAKLRGDLTRTTLPYPQGISFTHNKTSERGKDSSLIRDLTLEILHSIIHSMPK